jgi:hypothetical protein
MGVDGAGADHQPLGDLGVAQPGREQPQHFDLAPAQTLTPIAVATLLSERPE